MNDAPSDASLPRRRRRWRRWIIRGLLAVGAVVRAATPPPGPAALVARGRPLDVLMLFLLAFVLAILSQVIPTR